MTKRCARFLPVLCCCVLGISYDSRGIDNPSGGALTGERYRVVVTTDLGGSDEDDNQSMVHFLLYADLFDIEGIVSSPPRGSEAEIREVLDVYERDYTKLKSHSETYPEPDYLRSVTTSSAGKIVEAAGKDDSRPLWVLSWGAITRVSEALQQDPSIKSKLRVYFIGSWNKEQDQSSYNYIRDNHKDLWIIECNETFRGWYSGEGVEAWASGGNVEQDLSNNNFLKVHVADHGALGEYFLPLKNGRIKMGDTPSYVYLLRGNPEEPTTDHWGGRFVHINDGKDPPDNPDEYPSWYVDDPSEEWKAGGKDGALTIAQYRRNYFGDWAERMDRARWAWDETAPPAPAGVTAEPRDGHAVDLSWDASNDRESGIKSYRIHRDGELIDEVPETTFMDMNLLHNTDYSYTVSAVNVWGYEGGRSAPATTRTPEDTAEPRVIAISAHGAEDEVLIRFSEPLGDGAANASLYAIEGLSVSDAAIGIEPETVTLTVDAMQRGATYTITVSDVPDKAGKTLVSAHQETFAYTPLAPGLNYDYYEIDEMSAVPDFSQYEPVATGVNPYINYAIKLRSENYAFHFYGYLKVDRPGEYTFYSAADNGSTVSIDGEMVVDNSVYSGKEEKSGTCTLTKGYHPISIGYFDEGCCGEFLSVLWDGPGMEKDFIKSPSLFHAAGDGEELVSSAAERNRFGFRPATREVLSVTGAGEPLPNVFDLRGRRAGEVSTMHGLLRSGRNTTGVLIVRERGGNGNARRVIRMR